MDLPGGRDVENVGEGEWELLKVFFLMQSVYPFGHTLLSFWTYFVILLGDIQIWDR